MDNKLLDNLRHSCAHLLAKSVKDLWPGTHNGIGPSIENGFYQDFDFGETKISESDLPKIEEKMRQILPMWKSFTYNEVTLAEAKKLFKENPYKIEMAEEFAKGGKKLMTNNPGNFLDLCKMGHVEHPDKELTHFKLLSVAGAYWRGSEKNKMLTRIYGTCFPTAKELEDFLLRQDEAKKRDHKKISKELELFLISPSVGSGFPLYMPKGALLKRLLENWLIEEKEKRGFQFVWTPHIGKSDLYKQSGHWQKFDAMFNPMKVDDDEYVLKPMNCPHHFQIFNVRPRSYRELPLYLAENATVYRYEKAGELNGLFRVRALTQDDTHAFVRDQDISAEIQKVIDLTFHVYETFGFKNYKARISVRDPKNPDKYLGEVKNWDRAEKALVDAMKSQDVEYFVAEGEAAFYGPKIDVMVKDSLGREWQLTTVQLDFVQPENFDMKYINENGKEERPAVLHVAILGSVDRFFGILIEHFAGAFPVWLAPVQLTLIPIADRHQKAANILRDELKTQRIRVDVDDRQESMQSKIRQATLQKVPFLGIIGDKEITLDNLNYKNINVNLRSRDGKNLGVYNFDKLLSFLKLEIDNKN
ncbi:threonine--tRNA ligase [Candidatus Gottesmanbacteria bacterium RIFCSPHIGHO2_02_FULL_40_13]|uniref:Threonine--tRNA ligase n=1 Tax=Candidatus Gottesmanbacteria bacterium RIFCSPHIGHO2_02_FULL_40_13 TaxID=1798384 RepID=A0A1F6A803_9BACT|nr:MAG: threonine--tRNA ligase [Candidatus Gottesmanbacteria bacterium RIFCSPHIGHO2_02_FULL_40_13]